MARNGRSYAVDWAGPRPGPDRQVRPLRFWAGDPRSGTSGSYVSHRVPGADPGTFDAVPPYKFDVWRGRSWPEILRDGP